MWLGLRYGHLDEGFLCIVDKTDKLYKEKLSSDIRYMFLRKFMGTRHFRQITGPGMCASGEYGGLHVISIGVFAVWRLGFF